MKLTIYKHENNTWDKSFNKDLNSKSSLILVFGSSKKDLVKAPLKELVEFFDKSTILGASTAGEIFQDELLSDTIVVSVMTFSSTKIKSVSKPLKVIEDSYKSGEEIAQELFSDDLKAMFVLSEGLKVNGSKLTAGIASVLNTNIVVTGGLAGDDDRFENTWVIVDGKIKDGYITAVGLYGKYINVSHGSKGGWDTLGIERLVTKSKDNILYELDSQPALEIYKRYLGDKASQLPASGLLFPLQLKYKSDSLESKVRTILAVNEDAQSITFAGDVPEGSYVTLMKANFDRLIDGATNAAQSLVLDGYNGEDILSIAISCIGRKLVLKQRTEEELEATLEILPDKTKQIGFYSYGEISPLTSGVCDLHNQTMTLTLIWESDA
jgi:hypothetical protein